MKDYIVFSLSSNKQTARDFAKFWNCQLGKVSIKKFTDGEVLVKTLSDVEDKDVILIESTAKKPNDRIIEILQFLDSVNSAGARSVSLFIPYFGYSRQERVNYPNEPISCQVAAKAIETGIYDKLYSFDLHHPVIESFFSRKIKNIATTELFATYYTNYLKEKGIDNSDVVIISPDHGSNSRADMLMFALRGSHKVILDKVRPEPEQVEHLAISGDVSGKTCIIIDDIISTGRTIVSSAKLLYKKGAKSVLVGATHGLFSKTAIDDILKARVKDIAVTNTVEQPLPEKVKVLDIVSLIMKEL